MGKLAQVNIGERFLEDSSFLKETTDIGSLVSIIVQTAIGIAGIILLFLLIAGGIGIMAGGDNPEQAAKGKQAVTSALIGFIVVFAAYWVVKLIEIITGITIL